MHTYICIMRVAYKDLRRKKRGNGRGRGGGRGNWERREGDICTCESGSGVQRLMRKGHARNTREERNGDIGNGRGERKWG